MCDKLFDFVFLGVVPKKLACNLPLFSVFWTHFPFSDWNVPNIEEEFRKYLVVAIYRRQHLDFADVEASPIATGQLRVNRKITHHFTSWMVTNVLSYLCLVLNKVKNVRKPYMSILQHYIWS